LIHKDDPIIENIIKVPDRQNLAKTNKYISFDRNLIDWK